MRTNIGRLAATVAALTLFTTAQGAHAESDLKSMDDGAIQAYGDAGEQTYLAVELENVQITSYQLGILDNNSAGDVAIETMTIAHEGLTRQ